MKKTCGRATEVFSRVCGYCRPIKSWNKGKKEEFKERKTYKNVTSQQIITKAT